MLKVTRLLVDGAAAAAAWFAAPEDVWALLTVHVAWRSEARPKENAEAELQAYVCTPEALRGRLAGGFTPLVHPLLLLSYWDADELTAHVQACIVRCQRDTWAGSLRVLSHLFASSEAVGRPGTGRLRVLGVTVDHEDPVNAAPSNHEEICFLTHVEVRWCDDDLSIAPCTQVFHAYVLSPEAARRQLRDRFTLDLHPLIVVSAWDAAALERHVDAFVRGRECDTWEATDRALSCILQSEYDANLFDVRTRT